MTYFDLAFDPFDKDTLDRITCSVGSVYRTETSSSMITFSLSANLV
jgi:hypothetical protein